EDITPGSGVIEHLTPGMRLTAKDLATLMIIVSDNTATNICIDLCGGLPAINAHIGRLGIKNASVNRKIYDKSPNPLKKRLADVSARAFCDYLYAMRTTDALSDKSRELFFSILKKNQHKDMFGRFLPLEDYNEQDGNAPSLMNKNGWSDGTRTDAGILRLADGREYVYSVLINKCVDMSYAVTNKGAELIGKIGQIFYGEICG
ncbi:MAG: serine hydrolase, partial [Elusimicrobiales bacterium]|nr:serine hydrolase [Elusimicrobiales bacterium]